MQTDEAMPSQEPALNRWSDTIDNLIHRVDQSKCQIDALCTRLVGAIPSDPSTAELAKVGHEGAVHNMDDMLQRLRNEVSGLEEKIARLHQVGL